MVQRRSRRAQKKPPEVVPPKSDEEPDAEAGDANTAESEEENDAKTNTTAATSRPRRRQRGRKPRGSGTSENDDNSSDEGKSRENTDTGASSDDEPLSLKANRVRRQKKPAETDDAGKKTPKRRGRPRKNVEVESNDEDGSDAEKETIRKSKRRNAGRRKQQDPSSASDDESAKKPTRRRGRPKKNQDAEDSDSKMESAEEESASEEESTKKPTRRRGRPRKNQDAEDSDSKMETAEEDKGSSDDENATAKSKDKRKSRPSKTSEDASNGETTSRPTRKRGRPKKSSETASNDEGEQETLPIDAKKKATRHTPDPSSNAEQSSDEEAPRKRGRPGRPRSASTDEKGSNEASEPTARKRGRGRRTPSVSSSDDEASGSNQPTRVSKRRLEKIEETARPETDSATPSGEKKADEEPVETRTEKATAGEEASTEAAAKDKNEDESSSSKPEPQQEKQEKSSTKAAAKDTNKDEGPSSKPEPQQEKQEKASTKAPATDKGKDEGLSSKPEPQQVKQQEKASTKAAAKDKNKDEGSSSKPQQEKQETANGSTTETFMPTPLPKRQREPPKQPAETSGTSTIDGAETKGKDGEPDSKGKKRASTELDESTKDASHIAGDSDAKRAEPISKKAEAKSSSKPVEGKDSANEKSEISTTAQEQKDIETGIKILVAEKKAPSEEAPKGEEPDAPKKETVPKEKKEADVVLTATNDSKYKALDMGEGKKTELPTKVELLVTKPLLPKIEPLATKPTARQRSESHTNVPATKKKTQESEQATPQLSVNRSKPNAEKEAPTTSLEPTKKIETNDAVKVQPSPPASSNVHRKPQHQSLTSETKKAKADLSDPIMSSSKEAKKSDTQDGTRASNMDIDSPVKDLEMADVEKSAPTPQKDPDVAAAGETSHAKESQPKPSEIIQAVSDTKPEQTTTPIESEKEKLPSLEPPATALATKSISSETVVIPTHKSALHEDSNTGETDSKEAVASDKLSECVESSPVTESSDDEDEDESDDEEDRPEPRFETKVLPFTSSTLLPSPSKQQSSEELLGNKVNRVKTMLYTIGSKVHCGRGFERIFAKYWASLTMRLSDRLSSHASRQCDAAIKAFLKSPKLRRIHNKLVITLMKTSMKSFAPLNEISEYIPEMWYDKVKQVDRVLIEDGDKETKRQRKAREKRASRKQTTVYREAWASTQATEENPISTGCLKTRSQGVDMKKIHASSASIPGALVIDPLVREIAEQNNMRASENAIWLLVVAAREHTSNVLKNALKHKNDMECGEVSEPFLQYPKVLAGTKNTSKKDTPAEKTEQQPPAPAPVEYMPGKSQTRKVVTSFDIYASALAVPTGPPASLGGSVSTTALELCLQNAYTSSSSFPGTDFSDVQKHIVEGITALAQDRKAMLLARGEEAKSNQMNLVNSQPQVVTNSQKNVNSTSVTSNTQVGVGAPSAMGTRAVSVDTSAHGHGRQPQIIAPTTNAANTAKTEKTAKTTITTTKPALTAQMKPEKVDATPSSAPTNVPTAPLTTPADPTDAKSMAALPGGLGRGAKDLAALMKRSPADPGPVGDDKGTVAAESTTPPTNSSPQKPAESSDVDELGTSTGSGRRGKGFGTKNLAAMKARTSKPGEEEEAAPREGTPATVVSNEPQKQEPKTGTRPTGAKDLAALKGAAGAKDLAAPKTGTSATGAKDLAALKGAAGAKDLAAPKTGTSATGAKDLAALKGAAGAKDLAAPKTGTSATGAKDLAALKGAAGAKDLAALRARAAKASDEAGKKTEGVAVLTKPPNATEGKANPSKAPEPVNETKAGSAQAPSSADNKKADVPGSKDTTGGESDDSSVVVIESVKPAPAQSGNKDTSSSAGKGAVATTGQPNGQKVEVKAVNITSDTQPKPVIATGKPKESSSVTDKSPKETTVEKKEAEVSKDAPANAKGKAALEAKEDGGGQGTSSPPKAAATTHPAPSTDAVTPKGPEGTNEATSASKPDEIKAKEGSTAKPDGAKADESAAAKPEEKKVDSDGKKEPSK